MLPSKFSGENLAVDVVKPEVWRKTFRFLSIMELVKLRQVCQIFKEEVDFLFATQEKLGIFDPSRGSVHPDLCSDARYYVPNSSWIRLHSLEQHLPTLKSLFPSLKVLVMCTFVYKLYVEDILDSFVDLESFAIDGHIECCDTNRSYPKLKHLCLSFVIVAKLVALPSLESLRMNCDLLEFKPWMEKNFGRPSKSCEIDYDFCQNPDYPFQCLSSLPSSLECLKTGNFFGYSRQFKPMFPRLVEVSRVNREWFEDNFDDYGYTEFIDFLKDHRLTLKKVTTSLYSINDEQLKDMLSCLPHGTHLTISPPRELERVDDVRQYGLIGGLCRDNHLYLEINGYYMSESHSDRFLDIISPETQSLTLDVSHLTYDEASCRTLILEILASPLKSIILYMRSTKEAKRAWSTAIQELPETHETTLEWFPKLQKVIIRRRH